MLVHSGAGGSASLGCYAGCTWSRAQRAPCGRRIERTPPLAAAALPVLAVLLGSVAGQLWTDAVPALPLIDGDPLDGLDMRCTGDVDYLTGCLMRDLYFDTKKGAFTFFGRSIGSNEAKSDGEIRKLFNRETCARFPAARSCVCRCDCTCTINGSSPSRNVSRDALEPTRMSAQVSSCRHSTHLRCHGTALAADDTSQSLVLKLAIRRCAAHAAVLRCHAVGAESSWHM